MKKKERRFESLEEIDKLLLGGDRKSGKTYGKKNRKAAVPYRIDISAMLREYGRLLAVPVFCLLMLVLILLLEKPEGEPGTIAETKSGTETEAAEQIEESSAEEAGLKVCEIPEIRMLAEDYFAARLAADVPRIYEIFGRKADNRMEALETKLKAQASWVQTVDDITVYELPGMEKDARLCIITYSINFRRTDTDAPGIMYCYAERNAEGQYIFAENMRKDRLDYINGQLETEEVETLVTETNNALQNALNFDSELALIYTSFNNGEIYREADFEEDREQEVDLFLNPEDSDLVGAGIGAESGASADAEALAKIEGNEAGTNADDTDTAGADEAETNTAGIDAAETNASGAGTSGTDAAGTGTTGADTAETEIVISIE